jgi:dynein heavy chain
VQKPTTNAHEVERMERFLVSL